MHLAPRRGAGALNALNSYATPGSQARQQAEAERQTGLI